jgi:glyoxylase-like metal-dependent hydrolase (beta-lactamase superfamily II)
MKCYFIIFGVIITLNLIAQNNSYDIYAIKFGERKNYVRIADQAIGYKGADSTKVFFMYWLLKGKYNGKVILVDAGFTKDAAIDTNAITFTQPDKLLAGVNVKPEDITDIIITHPHWDHIGGIDLYPNAKVWIQEEDYTDFVAKRKDPEALGFNKKDIQKVLDRKAKGSIAIINMHGKKDQDILPGITVVLTGSQHTPGSQYVSANNGKQNVIIASDNCKYYRNITNMLSSPATSDQKAYIRNLRWMKLFTGGDTDLLIPGHDPLVFTKYKLVAKDIVEIKK